MPDPSEEAQRTGVVRASTIHWLLRHFTRSGQTRMLRSSCTKRSRKPRGVVIVNSPMKLFSLGLIGTSVLALVMGCGGDDTFHSTPATGGAAGSTATGSAGSSVGASGSGGASGTGSSTTSTGGAGGNAGSLDAGSGGSGGTSNAADAS